jgi:hypothetical protein
MLLHASCTHRGAYNSQELCGSATQLVSIAPTQPQLTGVSPPPYQAPRHAQPDYRQQQQQDWGLAKEASYWRELDQEALQETEEMSRQTTPGASRAASPGHGGPCTAPQASAADLAAVISQQLTQGTPGTEEILRHWPRVQASGRRRGGAVDGGWQRLSEWQQVCYN